MDNFGIGVDIENISRFKDKPFNLNKTFYHKIFTQKEIDYCNKKSNHSQHFAVRFAGKEAVIKALNSLGEKIPTYNQIEIINNKVGVPEISLKNFKIKVSLSHCTDKAIAFTIVEG